MDGGAWPFLVGGVICLVNSDNERDSPLLTSRLDLASKESCDYTYLQTLASVALSARVHFLCACVLRVTLSSKAQRCVSHSKSAAYSLSFVCDMCGTVSYER